MTESTQSTAKALESHNALVIPMSDGYAVSCSCGWSGGQYNTPEPAERAAEDHEAHPNGCRESDLAMPTTDLYDATDPRANPTGKEVKAWFGRIRAALRYAEEAFKEVARRRGATFERLPQMRGRDEWTTHGPKQNRLLDHLGRGLCHTVCCQRRIVRA
jgi:hypothetical protein